MPFENWEDTHQINKKKMFLIIILIVALIGTAIAAIKIISPDSGPVEVFDKPELSAPTFNATSLFKTDTLQITVKIIPTMEAVQVFFYENETQIGSAYTDSNGEAILNRVMNTIGAFVYYCDAIISP